MLALILSDTPSVHHDLTPRLHKRGFQVVNCETVTMATAHVRAWTFDLIIIAERTHSLLSHCVALSAEKHAPFVKTIMLSARSDREIEELYDLLPSLVSIISPDLDPEMIAQIALADVDGGAHQMAPMHKMAS